MIQLSEIKLFFKWRCPLSETHEGSSLIQDWEITARTMGDAFEDEQPVASWRIMVVPAGAPRPEVWLADQNSDAQRFQHLWLDNGWVRPELEMPRAIMLVAEAELSNWARGDGLGLVLTAMVVRRLINGVSHVALHPHPMQLIGDPAERALAVTKVEGVWKKIGARPLGGPGDLWVVDLDMALPHNKLGQLIDRYRERTELRHAGPTIS